MLAARGQQVLWTIIMAASCIINPLVNLACIPFAQQQWHNGALGAALSLLLTEILMMTYGVVLLRRIVLNRVMGRVAAVILVAMAAECGVLRLTTSLWPLIGQVVGLAVYAAVALTLDALPPEDVALLRETATKRLYRGRRRRLNLQAALDASDPPTP
jgi:hypothetical protein